MRLKLKFLFITNFLQRLWRQYKEKCVLKRLREEKAACVIQVFEFFN